MHPGGLPLFESLKMMLQQPIVDVEELGEGGGQPLCFLIDRVRQPDALAKLYGLSHSPEIELIFQQTEFSSLRDHSPIWVTTYAQSEAARLAASLCSDRRSGIALTSAEPAAALRQARRLCKATDPEGGFSLVRYYDPAFWSAWAMTWPTADLYGPWSRVYTPSGELEQNTWRVWQSTKEPTGAKPQAPSVSRETLLAFRVIRWWYWINSQPQGSAFSDKELPLVIENLQLLTEHGIEEGRHLQRLLPVLGSTAWVERSEVMALLRSDLPAHKKVTTLEA